MWQCPKCRSSVDDSFEVCWSCGTTPDGIEDPNFVTADEADPIPDEELPEGTELDDPLADFAGTPMPDLVQCYMASDTIEAKFASRTTAVQQKLKGRTARAPRPRRDPEVRR